MSNCEHEFTPGPFYLMAANTYEEPKYYPPNCMIRVEFCRKCGMVIIPIEYRDYHGENFASGKEAEHD